MTKIITTVYTLPDCVQCTATKKWLDKNNLKYDIVDLSENSEAYDYVVNTLNYKAAPVVTVMKEYGEGHLSFVSWNGYKPENLQDAIYND